MTIHHRVSDLLARMDSRPAYPTQGVTLFVDLEQRRVQRGYLPRTVFDHFIGGRGANMYLLYNLMEDEADPLDPGNPLIFGSGLFAGYMGTATRGNVSGLSPESDAILDCSAGDYFPAFMRQQGIDHLVLYGRPAGWSLLRIRDGQVRFDDATPYLGLDNIDLTAAIEQDYGLRERREMALARITRAGENQVLCAGIMGGPKAIWARGGPGAKMGALRVKGIMIEGRPGKIPASSAFKRNTKAINRRILATSVIRNALQTVGTPFLYKPSRVLGAMGTRNNQETTWSDRLDADNLDPYRPGMDGCFKCPVQCRPLNDMTPEAEGGFGAGALEGVTGNAGYAPEQAALRHDPAGPYRGVHGDGRYDRYDKGDGPEYVTLGKFGPNLGIASPEQVLRLNNILNDLGLDAASTGGAIGWAMELYQRGIIDQERCGGLALEWGNYQAVERLLFLTARREGFGNVIADSSRAVERGHYPPAALDYRMAVKGLFQSDPHDSRILKAFALGLAVATRGMDHLRNRATLEINARINDDPAFKTALYGGRVAAEPNSYQGKEYAVLRCEETYAVGDAVGMCRFDTQLFNSPSLPGCDDFAVQIEALTGIPVTAGDLLSRGRNITALERMINARRGLGSKDDTLPKRWFEEEIGAGPFRGERIDRERFRHLLQRYYRLAGFDRDGLPAPPWRQRLLRAVTGFGLAVTLPEIPGIDRRTLVIDHPVTSLAQLRGELAARFPAAVDALDDHSLGVAVNGELVVASENNITLRNGDQVELVPQLAGG